MPTKAHIRCTLVTPDGQTAYEGSADTPQEAQDRALQVALRRNPKAMISDFTSTFVSYGTPLDVDNADSAD